MNRILKFVLLTAALLSLASAAFAQVSSGLSFGEQKIQLTRSAPSVSPASMIYVDSLTFAPGDTVRTAAISTDGWDFAGSSVATTGTAVRFVAAIYFYGNKNGTNYALGDTITYVVEPSMDDGQTFISTFTGLLDNGAHALGNCAVRISQSGTAYNGAEPILYRGFITYDFDTAPAPAGSANWQPIFLRKFRLKLYGDAVGHIGSVRCKIVPLTQKIVR